MTPPNIFGEMFSFCYLCREKNKIMEKNAGLTPDDDLGTGKVNYVKVVEGSEHVTDLEMLINHIKYVVRPRLDSKDESLDQLIKVLENTKKQGYDLKKVEPESGDDLNIVYQNIPTGWRCPNCGRGIAPWITVCPHCPPIPYYPIYPWNPPYVPYQPTTPIYPNEPWYITSETSADGSTTWTYHSGSPTDEKIQ